MTHWCPQTSESNWIFHPAHRKLQGIRATHQPSPWIGDYGSITVMPQSGERLLPAEQRAAAFRLSDCVLQPGYMRFELLRYGVMIEAVPTERCAVFRFHFPANTETRVIVDPLKGEGRAVAPSGDTPLLIETRGSSGGAPANFACYVAVQTHEYEAVELYHSSARPSTTTEARGVRAGGVIEFGTSSGRVIEVRIGMSFISFDQAACNMELEFGGCSFEELKRAATEVWEERLSRIEIEGATDRQRRTFYSCLYRTNLFPRKFHELTPDGNTRHYSPYDGGVHPGVLYTDNGFWDTYRTVYPLFSLTMPDQLPEILEGWVNAAKEGGWFPQWASPGYRACMVGTHIDAVIADAVTKGITDFDVDTAYHAMLRHANAPGDDAGSYGRIGIRDYLNMGYVAANHHHESVARTLDYAYDDFCIAAVAEHLGDTANRDTLLRRAHNYRHLFDSKTGFMRGRNADGKFTEPFDAYRWGSPYVEGGPWQSSWAVQHDPAGLIRLMGGRTRFIERLSEMMSTPPRFGVGAYRSEIHEMTEMALADFGQYAHSNQPVHHALYLHTAAGRPDLAEHWVRQALDRLYSPGGFAGDEDNGEMSAWYILSALGIYPLCPGHPGYVLGSGLFPRAILRPPSGKAVTIEDDSQSETGPIGRVVWNGTEHASLEIAHSALVGGGTLSFHHTSGGRDGEISRNHLPFSLSEYDG